MCASLGFQEMGSDSFEKCLGKLNASKILVIINNISSSTMVSLLAASAHDRVCAVTFACSSFLLLLGHSWSKKCF